MEALVAVAEVAIVAAAEVATAEIAMEAKVMTRDPIRRILWL